MVEYMIDEENMTVEQIWQYGKERGTSMYSEYMSGVSFLPNGNRYIVSGDIRFDPFAYIRVIEVVPNREGTRAFEAVVPTSHGSCKAYRGTRISLYTE